ncbi:Clavaminate synthase [Phytophthora megakarya]|uniref:Clavaminate synthase n=1 Tax=Phytophthora megakarya TaxID=4795 RepID=A0A225WYF9_9STRA|nr:Clavaminate synthase [Phytophthora megakarya]
MGKKSKASSGRKRKAGHLGFQAGEIAFIEDEMAALAAEYGLEVDGDVASHVQQRKQSKKTRRRQLSVNRDQHSSNSSGVKLLQEKPTQTEPEDAQDAQKLVLKRLAVVLPDTCALRTCGVPGCSCVNGSRSLGLQEREDTDKRSKDVIEVAQCQKCQHGVLQHAVVLREDAEPAAALPSGGQRLLQTLFQLIRLGRLGGSIFKSRVWTKSALERLEAVLLHLKKQFAAGGTQNGQKSTDEIRQEMQLLTDLQTQLRKAQQTVATASRDELPISLACVFDQMYFHTYYAALVLYGRACGAVPSPETYLKELERFTPESTSQLEAFVNRELSGADVPARLMKSLALPVASSTSQDEIARERLRAQQQESENPLLTIYHSRLREGVRLFYEEGVGMDGEMDAVLTAPKCTDSVANKKAKGSKKKPQKKHYRRERKDTARSDAEGSSSTLVEMPSYPLLAQWRNNCRDWCCHLYAYATPTQEALDVIAKHAPIVEVGAGTGYWSSLLQRADVDVVAYDKAPPSAEAAEGNAYHGHVPPFCAVGRGGPEVLGQDDMADRSLFLCYPPPGDTMAVRSVQLFQGDVILHVGEWQGDTGDSRFESELQRRFVLEQEISLPNWGNSAYGLTVWRRKSKEVESVGWRAMSCFYCDKNLADAAAEDEPLRRCVVCKTNVYCSSTCAQRDAVGHAAEHATRLVFLEDPTSDVAYDRIFENEAYYRELEDPDLDDTVVAVKSNWNALVKADSAHDHATDSNTNSEDDESEAESDSEPPQPTKKATFAFNFDA